MSRSLILLGLFLLINNVTHASNYQKCDALPIYNNVDYIEFIDNNELTRIEFPNLKNELCNIAGDWGPNYYFKEGALIKVINANSSAYTSPTFRLTFSSTMFARERELYPNSLEFVIPSYSKKYIIRFDNNGPNQIVVKNTSTRKTLVTIDDLDYLLR